MARKTVTASRPRKAAAFNPAGLRMVALRVGGALALAGVGVGVYLYHGPAKTRVAQVERPAAVAVAPPVMVAPAAPTAPEPAPPEPPRRDPSLDAVKTMPASLRTAFDTWLMGAYAKCWKSPKTLPDGDPYLPKVRVAFKEDGGLASPPKLVNPPSDPAWKAHAEAALKAVKGCDPLHVPDKYAEYYPSWKSKTVYFDPARN
jgi:hypothetical protein